MATTVEQHREIGPVRRPAPAFSMVSILAVVSAVLSFAFGATLGFLLAIAAIILGVIGVVVSLLPSVRGGLLSFFSIAAGLMGIVAAFFKLVL